MQPTEDLARKRAIVLSQDARLRLSFEELVKKHKAIDYEQFWRDYEEVTQSFHFLMTVFFVSKIRNI